jgi:hypothetical protein
VRPVVVRGPADHRPDPAPAVRGEDLGGHRGTRSSLPAARRGGQVLAQRPADRPVGVQVVGEYQAGARRPGGREDGPGQRGKQLGPSGVGRARAVIDQRRPGRRSRGLGRVGRIVGHSLRSVGCPAAATDGPDPLTAAHQLGDHGRADGASSAENDVNKAIWRAHRSSLGCGRAPSRTRFSVLPPAPRSGSPRQHADQRLPPPPAHRRTESLIRTARPIIGPESTTAQSRREIHGQ